MAALVKFMVDHLNLNNADISAGVADAGTDGFTEREQHLFGRVRVRDVIMDSQGIAVALIHRGGVGQLCGLDAVGIVPDGVAVCF